MRVRFPSKLRNIFSAVALAGGMLGAQACASAGGPRLPGAEPIPADSFDLFISDQTETSLGAMAAPLKRALPQWAQADILLLTPGDTEGLAPFPNGYYPTDAELEAAAASMKTIFSRHPEFADAPQYVNQTDAEKLAYIYWTVKSGEAGALDLWDGARKAAIIIMPDFTAESMPLLNSLPDSIFSRKPDISFEEFAVNVLMHEAGHIRLGHALYTPDSRPGQDLLSLERETAADRFLLSGYKEAAERGLPYDEDLPAFVHDMRAISALRVMGGVTSQGWFAFYTHGSHITLDLVAGRNGTEVIADDRFDTPQKAVGTALVRNLAVAALASVTRAGITPDPNDPQYPFGIESSTFNNVYSDYHAGTAIAWNYIYLQYGAVRVLMDRGHFEADSVEAVIAGEYLEAFEKYAPGVRTDPGLQEFLAAAAAMPDLFSHTVLKPADIHESADEDYRRMKQALDALRAEPVPPAAPDTTAAPAPAPRMF